MATVTARDFPTQMFIDGQWCDSQDGETLAMGGTTPRSKGAKGPYAIKPAGGAGGPTPPWTSPGALPSRKIAPALAAGCTVVRAGAILRLGSAAGKFQGVIVPTTPTA